MSELRPDNWWEITPRWRWRKTGGPFVFVWEIYSERYGNVAAGEKLYPDDHDGYQAALDRCHAMNNAEREKYLAMPIKAAPPNPFAALAAPKSPNPFEGLFQNL